MNSEPQKTAVLKSYLLGDLSEIELEQLEEQYFNDPELFRELCAVRDDLIDEFVRCELSSEERKKFEAFFLNTSSRRERIRFAETLKRKVDLESVKAISQIQEPSTERRRSLRRIFERYQQPVFATVVLVVLGVTSWFVFKRLRQPQEKPDRVAVSTPQPAASPTSSQATASDSAPKPTTEVPRSKPAVATFLIAPTLMRSTQETSKLVIPKGTEVVQLQLSLEGTPYSNYRAVLATPEGRTLSGPKQLKPRPSHSGKVLILSLPANLFTNADYIIQLTSLNSGGERLNSGSYYFRIEKQ